VVLIFLITSFNLLVGDGDYYGTNDSEKWFLVFFISISTFVVAASFGVFIDIIIGIKFLFYFSSLFHVVLID
jgi:hypothetical protein